ICDASAQPEALARLTTPRGLRTVLAGAESSPRADKQFLEHMPQLDSLRALAALAVFVTHYLPADERWRHVWGWMGVRLFFVLSGFLITSLLLKCRFERERQQL